MVILRLIGIRALKYTTTAKFNKHNDETRSYTRITNLLAELRHLFSIRLRIMFGDESQLQKHAISKLNFIT